MAEIAFFPKICVFLKIHHYFANCFTKKLLESIDAEFYVKYFGFERLKRKVGSFKVKYKSIKKSVKIEFLTLFLHRKLSYSAEKKLFRNQQVINFPKIPILSI